MTKLLTIWRRLALTALLAITSGFLPLSATAQDASSMVHIVVPYPPGGTTDIMGRIIAQKLGDALKQSVITENRPGAGGNIGAAFVAKAKPNGNTLLFTAVTTPAIAHTLYKNLQYDVRKDLEPVAVVGSLPFVLLVSNNLPVKNIGELLALAKSKSGQINFGSAGVGTTAHLAGELFKSMAGVNLVHVPYQGDGPALIGLIGGQIDMMFDFIPSALQLVKSGKVRAIAVTSAVRSPVLPNVPTVAESGVPGYEVLSYFGLMAPTQTPKAVIEKLNADLNRIDGTEEIKERYAREGVVPAAESTAWFSKYLDAEIIRWGKVVKDANIRTE